MPHRVLISIRIGNQAAGHYFFNGKMQGKVALKNKLERKREKSWPAA